MAPGMRLPGQWPPRAPTLGDAPESSFSYRKEQVMRKPKPPRRSVRLPRSLHLLVLEDRCLLSTYTLTDLGPGIAYGINDAGLVVGGGGHAFTWDSTHGMQELETL